MTTRPDDRPSWPAALAPTLGAVLIGVALLSLLSRPWLHEDKLAETKAASAVQPNAGPVEIEGVQASRPAEGGALDHGGSSSDVRDRDLPPGPTEIVPPSNGSEGQVPEAPRASEATPDVSTETDAAPEASPLDEEVQELCERISRKLSSISLTECLRFGLRPTDGRSVLGAPIVAVDYRPKGQSRSQDVPRVLLLGGIHGDEYSSVTIMFKWLAELESAADRPLHWRILPLLNPDGLLRARSQRMNERGVDLNRNFPTPNWEVDATDYWVRRTGRNPRRYPGPAPLSEPESRFLHDEIARFKPDVIVAVHAPLEVVDFDGPNEPPDRLGSLYLKRMGTYPGSLGRYGGEHVGLPVVTIELPSAGTMPPKSEQRKVWNDLGAYLERTLLAEPAATTAAAANR